MKTKRIPVVLLTGVLIAGTITGIALMIPQKGSDNGCRPPAGASQGSAGKKAERRTPENIGMPDTTYKKVGDRADGINGSPPSVSGPATVLPWDADPAFTEARDKNNTPVLMAAYCTVLRDPLPGEESNVHLAASLLAGTVVESGQVFSLNGGIGPYNESKGFKEGPMYMGQTLVKTIGGGVCKIATTLFNVVVLSDLQVVERHRHTMPVPYVPYGQDATVAYGKIDFKFKNTSPGPILIWSKGIGNALYIAFYGRNKPAPVTWRHEIVETYKAPRIYRKNPSLAAGTEKVVLEGMDGATVKSWITVGDSNSRTTRYLGSFRYEPMAYIIETNN